MQPRKTYPDFGSLSEAIPTPGIDITEIPARLGSPVTLRRMGKVYWYSLFDDINTWITSGTPGYSVDVHASGMFGPGACRITPGGGAPYTAEAKIVLPLFRVRTISMECNFNMSTGISIFKLRTTRSEAPFQGAIRISTLSVDACYLSTSGWVKFADIHDFVNRHWHNVKLTVNFADGAYKYVAFDDDEMYLNAAMPTVAVTGENVSCILSQEETTLMPLYVDYIVITLDEL